MVVTTQDSCLSCICLGLVGWTDYERLAQIVSYVLQSQCCESRYSRLKHYQIQLVLCPPERRGLVRLVLRQGLVRSASPCWRRYSTLRSLWTAIRESGSQPTICSTGTHLQHNIRIQLSRTESFHTSAICIQTINARRRVTNYEKTNKNIKYFQVH